MKKNIFKSGLSALIWLMYVIPAMAIPDEPPMEEDPPAPIDEWATLLLLAGIGICIFVLVLNKIKSAIYPE